jgi:hypothetical protein
MKWMGLAGWRDGGETTEALRSYEERRKGQAEGDVLEGGSVVSGFRCPVAALFAGVRRA